jgi:hypothetical protein
VLENRTAPLRRMAVLRKPALADFFRGLFSLWVLNFGTREENPQTEVCAT